MPNRVILFVVALGLGPSCRESDPDRHRAADASARSESDAGGDSIGDEDASSVAPECQLISPPRIVLSSQAGEQAGLEGSYCGGACAAPGCADRPTLVWGFTVVHPGDELTISAPEAELMPGQGCQPACPPRVRIVPLCDRNEEAATLEFVEDVAWPVELPEGTYAVEVTTHVDAESGWRGSLGYGFGLIVDGERPRAVMESAASDPKCGVARARQR